MAETIAKCKKVIFQFEKFVGKKMCNVTVSKNIYLISRYDKIITFHNSGHDHDS